ncbi:MAG TPA: 50S ribosomal protein L11 methyltransferase [Alcanivoracaceae bacterium]|nr:50S ribosomal protein L11 methyltransferase [Alcanivoracaceae bacterium]
MAWLQLHYPTDQAQAEFVEELMLGLGAYSVSLTDSADEPIFEPPPGTTPLWRQVTITALFAADINQEALLLEIAQQMGGLPADLVFEPLAEQAWERAWMADFHPMQFGERLWIVPSWTEPPEPNAVNLHLDPGLAFGTGTHETTALCLTWLEGLDLQGKTVLDYGSGSGVLAIAALLLGAEAAFACDIDPQALLATRENAKLNGVSERLFCMPPEELPARQYEVVVANILAEPLVNLADHILGFCAPNAHLGLSGILLDQAEMVRDAYSGKTHLEPNTTMGEWVLVHGRRK